MYLLKCYIGQINTNLLLLLLLNSISFVFDQFSDNLFTASHMHNLESSLAYIEVLMDCYRHKNIFVQSTKESIHIIIHMNHVKCN